MYVSFVTRERPPSNRWPIVHYCETNCLSLGETTTYNVHNRHYWIHYIYVRSLEPGLKCHYKLGFIEPDNITIRHPYSNEHWTFQTSFSLEKQGTEIVYMYGDMGTIMPLGFEVTKSIIEDFNKKKNERANYVVHVGDVVYGGTDGEMELRTIWDLFIHKIAPIASQIPYMTATGNHEKYYNYTSYKTGFFMPSKTNPTALDKDGNFYFTPETNLVQWIVLYTEHDCKPGSFPQRISTKMARKTTTNVFIRSSNRLRSVTGTNRIRISSKPC